MPDRFTRGPFTIKWGENTLEDIQEIDIDYDQNTEDYETVKGKVIELDKGIKVSAELTLLATDIASLAVLLPQHYVPQGGTLSTGQLVSNPAGAIDILPHKCDDTLLYNDLDIISCNNPKQTTRIVHARSKLTGIEVDSKIQKMKVKLTGEPATGEAMVQVFGQDTFQVFMLDNGKLFLTNDGHALIV